MIIRTRPKYFEITMLDGLCNTISGSNCDKELFFSTGRAALKFLLSNYKVFFQKKPLILMQSFNCNVVIDAALEAGFEIALIDIKLDDLSIDLKKIKELEFKPDVLILTHYQGIPNLEYFEISDYCRKNNIFLIDDISQTEGSQLNDVKIGSLGQAVLRSFAFDKPFTCWNGGSIIIANIDNQEFKKNLEINYQKIPIEPMKKKCIDLRKLSFYYKYTDNSITDLNIGQYEYINYLIELGISNNVIIKFINSKLFLYYKLLSKIYKKIFYKKNIIQVKRLNKEKIELVKLQEAKFSYSDSEVTALISILEENKFSIIKNDNAIICWNRFSLIDSTGRLVNMLEKIGVEVGNFNWPNPLHILYKDDSRVFFYGRFSNTEFASRYIVNIPVWSNFFQEWVKGNG